MKKKLLAFMVMGIMLLAIAAPTFAFGGGGQEPRRRKVADPWTRLPCFLRIRLLLVASVNKGRDPTVS
jgi:hypothetical protein